MYEKIFPSRVSEVREYLSQRSISIDPSKKIHAETADPIKTTQQEVLEFPDLISS